MEPNIWYEIIGYAASVLVAVSLTMRSILKLRIISLIGSLVFTVYGLLIGAYPVAAMNFFIVLINLYYLWQMRSTKEFFRLLPIRPDSEYLLAFLDFYQNDIQKFLPGFSYLPTGYELTFFVLRNMVPAGLVIGEVRDGDCLYLQLDYAIPGYRDLKIGKFVFQENPQAFRERGIRRIYNAAGAPAHAHYLEQIGFVREISREGELRFRLEI